MSSEQIKIIVGENCFGYEYKYPFILSNVDSHANSCSTCKNYVNGKCINNFYDNIKDKLTIN